MLYVTWESKGVPLVSCVGIIQNLSNFKGQVLHRERFLDEVYAFVQHPLVSDYVRRVAGDVQAFDPRLDVTNQFRKC